MVEREIKQRNVSDINITYIGCLVDGEDKIIDDIVQLLTAGNILPALEKGCVIVAKNATPLVELSKKLRPVEVLLGTDKLRLAPAQVVGVICFGGEAFKDADVVPKDDALLGSLVGGLLLGHQRACLKKDARFESLACLGANFAPREIVDNALFEGEIRMIVGGHGADGAVARPLVLVVRVLVGGGVARKTRHGRAAVVINDEGRPKGTEENRKDGVAVEGGRVHGMHWRLDESTFCCGGK